MKTLPGSNASIPYEVHVKLNPIQLKGYVDKTNGVNANDGDVIVLAGKGHEDYQEIKITGSEERWRKRELIL